MSEIVKKDDASIMANIVLKGDISGLNPTDKVRYYNMFCESLGLNPVTKPFQIIIFQNKEQLYATKDATEQLRKINGVSVIDLQKDFRDGLYIVTAKVQDKTGRFDMATGAVNITGLKGDALANAIMKAETKAKRRATLSICGLGILDESEIETIPDHKIQEVHDNGLKEKLLEKAREYAKDMNPSQKQYYADIRKKPSITESEYMQELAKLEALIGVLKPKIEITTEQDTEPNFEQQEEKKDLPVGVL